MTRITIDLPENVAEKLLDRARKGGFGNSQEYVLALIDADTRDPSIPSPTTFHEELQLTALLAEGIASGDSGEITAAQWEQKRHNLKQRHSKAAKR